MTKSPQHIIDRAVASPKRKGRRIELKAGRLTLAKRRWHGIAEDGTEFGFDLTRPLMDGAVILEDEYAHYILTQSAEPVLEVALPETMTAAKITWSLGNLHFPIELAGEVIRVNDDPAARLYFEREKITFIAVTRVFHPLKAIAHSHAPGHVH